MTSLNKVFLSCSVVIVSACGGGASPVAPEAPVAPVASVINNTLQKYQGTWIQQCSLPATAKGGGSRKKLVISAPDASGAVQIDAIEELFETQLGCYDYTSVPAFVITDSLPSKGVFARNENLCNLPNCGPNDVLTVSVPATNVEIKGQNYSTVVVNGVEKCRVSFLNGAFIDYDKVDAAETGEIGFILSGFNGVNNSLSLYGAPYSEFIKQ